MKLAALAAAWLELIPRLPAGWLTVVVVSASWAGRPRGEMLLTPILLPMRLASNLLFVVVLAEEVAVVMFLLLGMMDQIQV